jgi:hypothetical protein
LASADAAVRTLAARADASWRGDRPHAGAQDALRAGLPDLDHLDEPGWLPG